MPYTEQKYESEGTEKQEGDINVISHNRPPRVNWN